MAAWRVLRPSRDEQLGRRVVGGRLLAGFLHKGQAVHKDLGDIQMGCDALEGQLSGLRDLPAQLEVALKRSKEVRVATAVKPKRRRSNQ
ncbi:hypothetical protein C7E15_00580 [Stenotrophomonas maltophilia]|nr:hypothetical protein C7E15_00580 [Stenotrophomonas maltophilia]